MKLKFEEILKLTDLEIAEGILCCFGNANDLFNSAMLLKKNKKFGLATTILILSIEELMKGFSLLNILILNDKDSMRDFFESRNLHKTRHYLALFTNEIFKVVDVKKISETDLDVDNTEELSSFLCKELNIEKVLKNIEKEDSFLTNWFVQANEKKNNGLYVSLNNNSFFTPQKTEEKEFTKAYRATNRIRKMFSFVIIIFITTRKEELQELIDYFKLVSELVEENFTNTTANSCQTQSLRSG